ncbi:hypothetical protein [Kitasatospora kifunensis]|uniref:Uncharacterized protein n=1 Tax=Kitasatospora kifunensis TaxID=58351 RepID=A0A7W7VTY0_KITKI|nr:hypothetical protein [Kitasatospora kifunensis]MBB4922243.1 hypothetical protein [Kitasatospora kifunensis]
MTVAPDGAGYHNLAGAPVTTQLYLVGQYTCGGCGLTETVTTEQLGGAQPRQDLRRGTPMINREKYPLLGAAADALDAGDSKRADALVRAAEIAGTPAEKAALATTDRLIAAADQLIAGTADQ